MSTSTVPHPYDDAQFYDGVLLRRLVAFFIDVVISTLLMGVIIVVGTIFTVLTLGLGLLVVIPIFIAADFLYRWLTIASGSATWGMVICGIELRDRRGERLDAGQALVHTGAYYILLAMAIPPLINLLVPLISPHGRLIHDFLLGTVAINRPV